MSANKNCFPIWLKWSDAVSHVCVPTPFIAREFRIGSTRFFWVESNRFSWVESNRFSSVQPDFHGFNQPDFPALIHQIFKGWIYRNFSVLNEPGFPGLNEPDFPGLNPPYFPCNKQEKKVCLLWMSHAWPWTYTSDIQIMKPVSRVSRLQNQLSGTSYAIIL